MAWRPPLEVVPDPRVARILSLAPLELGAAPLWLRQREDFALVLCCACRAPLEMVVRLLSCWHRCRSLPLLGRFVRGGRGLGCPPCDNKKKEVECTRPRQQIYVINSKLSSCEQTALLVSRRSTPYFFDSNRRPTCSTSSFQINVSLSTRSLDTGVAANAFVNYLMQRNSSLQIFHHIINSIQCQPSKSLDTIAANASINSLL